MIYFVQTEDNQFIKIGLAEDPIRRLPGIQVGIPYTLKLLVAFPGERQDEQYFHKKFDALRVRGEWFKATYDLVFYGLKRGLEYTCQNYRQKHRWAATFAALLPIEPQLHDLYAQAASTCDDGKEPYFCANSVWYGYSGWDGLKPQLKKLVGWGAYTDIPELRTRDAYSAAYQTIYEALPHCRNCQCA